MNNNNTKAEFNVKEWNKHYRKECIKDIALKIYSSVLIALSALSVFCIVYGIVSLF